MPIPIRTDRVREALRPFVGSETLSRCGVAEASAELLRRFPPHQQPLEALERQLQETIFGELYALLGPRMTFRLDDGRPSRILMAQLPDVADSVLGVLFDSLPADESTLELLRSYAMRTTSLSAMRALLLRFGDRQSAEERAILARIIRDNYPPERYADWLPDS